MTEQRYFAQGGCGCGDIRYRLMSPPLFVHCCHCRWCQRETGAAFAVNAIIEASRVEVIEGDPVRIKTPSESGKGQTFSRCPNCQIAVWSNYAGAGDKLHFIRVGTLDHPDLAPPDIHIFTESKQTWVVLDDGKPVYERYYKMREEWPEESQRRREAIIA